MRKNTITITSYLFIFMVVFLLVSISACGIFGEDTKSCTTTCFSKSTGQNLGSVTFDNYTKEECEEALNNRQTILTDCNMEWE